MNFCEKCKHKECQYIEIKKFLECILDEYGKKYKLVACPDEQKDKYDYTCDMIFEDEESKEKLYVEVKDAWLGFENTGADKTKKTHNSQVKCQEVITQILEEIEDEKRYELDDFVVEIPVFAIVDKPEDFYNKMSEFIDKTDFEDDDYVFKYGSEVEIIFSRKDSKMDELSERILFCYSLRNNLTIDSELDKMSNVDELNMLLKKNAEKTSQKKFPETTDRKILLNVLKIPRGYNLFVECNMDYLIGQCILNAGNYESSADENYLLYYSDNYNKFTREDEKVNVEELGEALLIIPLKAGLIKQPNIYVF